MSELTFESLALSPEVNRALADMKFTTPSPIQVEAIPVMMENRDLIGQAQTGTGKTAAFAIPIIEKIDVENPNVQAVVMCPTRELAMQVAEEFRKLAKFKKGVLTVCVYGGQPMDRQMMALQCKPQIIVGTPGRMMDHLWRGTIDLSYVETVVLDEADEMLAIGFLEDIEKIFDFVPQERQTVLFSATMPKPILELTQRFQYEPHRIRIQPQHLETELIEQHYMECSYRAKPEALARLIQSYQIKLTLVFCNTKRHVDELVAILRASGHAAEAIHGGLTQQRRESIMRRFRKGHIPILVATDVAARGIDVRNIDAVFNYELPEDTESYIHRIGRTGRAGKTGRAFSLVSGNQMQKLRILQKMMKHPIRPLGSNCEPIAERPIPQHHAGGPGQPGGPPKKSGNNNYRKRRSRPQGASLKQA